MDCAIFSSEIRRQKKPGHMAGQLSYLTSNEVRGRVKDLLGRQCRSWRDATRIPGHCLYLIVIAN